MESKETICENKRNVYKRKLRNEYRIKKKALRDNAKQVATAS